LEAGSGVVNNIGYSAKVGSDTINGVDQELSSYDISGISDINSVIATKTGEDGGDGGWAILNGSYAANNIPLSIDEDQIVDIERMHTTEQVAYVAFGTLAPNLNTAIIPAVGDTWQTIDIGSNYNSMVVVTTPLYDTTQIPVVIRVRNAEGSSFEIKAQRADGDSSPLDQDVEVHYVVVEEGQYTAEEHGITMEAVKYTSTVTDGLNNWEGESRNYLGTLFLESRLYKN